MHKNGNTDGLDSVRVASFENVDSLFASMAHLRFLEKKYMNQIPEQLNLSKSAKTWVLLRCSNLSKSARWKNEKFKMLQGRRRYLNLWIETLTDPAKMSVSWMMKNGIYENSYSSSSFCLGSGIWKQQK